MKNRKPDLDREIAEALARSPGAASASAARKRQAQSRIAELFSMSQDRIEEARRTFDAALTALTNARTYGTEAHAAAAARSLLGSLAEQRKG